MEILEEKASKNSTIYIYGYRTYDRLVNYGDKQHFRVNIPIMKFSMDEITSTQLRISGDFVRYV